jgi:hypothetical protein
MKQQLMRYGFACALGLGLATLPAGTSAADDTKTPAKETPTKAPDFSKYVYVKDVTGEVVKADDKKITVRISGTGLKAQPNPKARPMVVEMHTDYEYTFLPESLVRTLVLPPKPEENGKKVPYTPKEKEALKIPVGVIGYVAATSDLTKGTTVNVILVREKSISASKATDDDLRIKYVVIQPPPTK